jgi:hypothetical protein
VIGHWVCLLLLSAASAASAGVPPVAGPALSVRLPPRARLGEWIEVEVTGRLPPDTREVGPRFGHELAGLEVLESGPAPATDGFFRWRLRLVGFQPGPHRIPPLTFWSRGEAAGEIELATAALEVEIEQPALAPETDLRPSRPPASLPLTLQGCLALGLLSGAAVALAAGLVVQRRHRASSPAVPPGPPPRERALGELNGLEREIPVPGPRAPEFYGRLVDVLRGFLAGAEGLTAFHMTSGQILEAAGALAAPGARRALAGVLLAADEVKFGGGLPDGMTQVRHVAAARNAVDDWKGARSGRVGDAVD